MLQLANNGLAVRTMDGRRTLLGIYKKIPKSNELAQTIENAQRKDNR